MDYGAAILALLVANEITLLKILISLQDKNVLPRLSPKLKYNQVVLRLRNMGEVKPVPALDPDVEIRFARALLIAPKGTIKLTEAEWILTGRWKELGGGAPVNFRKVMDKWSVEKIVYRSNPGVKKSTYVLARDWRGRLKAKLPSPASVVSTPKRGGNAAN